MPPANIGLRELRLCKEVFLGTPFFWDMTLHLENLLPFFLGKLMSPSSRVWMSKKMYEIFLSEFWTSVDEGKGLFRKAGSGLQSHAASYVRKSESSYLGLRWATLTISEVCHHNLSLIMYGSIKRGRADKSLTWPGKKQATAAKLGIYSTYSPRSSIHFLVRCSNFCKPLKKKLESCPSNQVSAAAITSASDEKWRPFNCLFSPGNSW